MSAQVASIAGQPSAEETARRFVRIVRELSWVRRVTFMDSAEPRVLTVIDAPPFDRAYRNPVYDAELQAIDEVGGAQPSFSLVNIRERAEGSTSETESTETVLLDR